MWLFTKIGFFSAVRTGDNDEQMMVRSRDKKHLEALIKECGLRKPATPGHYWEMVLDKNGQRMEVCKDCGQRPTDCYKTCQGGPISVITTTDSDYKYRIIIPITEWLNVVMDLASDIDYSNFKNAVFETHGACDYEFALHQVWAAMYNTQK